MGTLGERIQAFRKRRALTQRELATASGVSVSLIRQLEQGVLDDTRMETAHRLARALRVSTTALLATHDERPEPSAQPWLPLRAAVEGPAPQLDEEPTLAGCRTRWRTCAARSSGSGASVTQPRS
jgi:transcriptional regulator with XRE-family HTH domain